MARPLLAVVAGVNSLAAASGAAGLAFGFLDTGPEVEARFPFGSTVLAGLALLAVVAVPLGALAVLAATGHRRTPDATVVAGVLLAGWIVVQIAVIRELSWFQPCYGALGLALVAVGLRARRAG